MKECCKITFSNKEIYILPEEKESFIELAKKHKASIDLGLVDENVPLCNIQQAIETINNISKYNIKYKFIPLSNKSNKFITPNNYLDYEEQSNYIRSKIYRILISGKPITLTEIIEKIKDVKLSRVGWTNHLRIVIKKLTENHFIVNRENKRYTCIKKNQN